MAFSTAFQSNAFQNNAFQIEAAVDQAGVDQGGGWLSPEQVSVVRERLLALQKANRGRQRISQSKQLEREILAALEPQAVPARREVAEAVVAVIDEVAPETVTYGEVPSIDYVALSKQVGAIDAVLRELQARTISEEDDMEVLMLAIA